MFVDLFGPDEPEEADCITRREESVIYVLLVLHRNLRLEWLYRHASRGVFDRAFKEA